MFFFKIYTTRNDFVLNTRKPIAGPLRKTVHKNNFCKFQSGFLFTRKFINLIYVEAYLYRATLSPKRKCFLYPHATSPFALNIKYFPFFILYVKYETFKSCKNKTKFIKHKSCIPATPNANPFH